VLDGLVEVEVTQSKEGGKRCKERSDSLFSLLLSMRSILLELGINCPRSLDAST
jgi:hypothetical protein